MPVIPDDCISGTLTQSFFFDFKGYYAIGGVGLRNATTDQANPDKPSVAAGGVSFKISDPKITKSQYTFTMKRNKAYLYWNVIAKASTPIDDYDSIEFAGDSGVFQTTINAVHIGTCSNTCWSAYGPLDPPDPFPDDKLVNYVFRSDVSSQVSSATTQFLKFANKTYKVADFKVSNSMSYDLDGTKYPGVHATQGVVLLIIFDWVDGPSTQGYPPEKDFWKIRVFDGAALLDPSKSPCQQIVHPAVCFGCPNFVFAMGDAQRVWSDMVYINGKRGIDYPDHPQNTPTAPAAQEVAGPQVLWQNVGEGLGIQEYVLPVPDETITIDAVTETDCMCWFLYVHAAHCCNCHVKIRLMTEAVGGGGSSAGLFINENSEVISLGYQDVRAIILQDACDCLDFYYPVIFIINDEIDDPPQSPRTISSGDKVDIELNSTQCAVCEQWGPYCCTSGSSGIPRTSLPSRVGGKG